jgi:NAD(P)H dehydrogenase (quinone)
MILVSGASGNVGGVVVRELLQAGAAIRALTRDPGRVARSLPQVDVVAGDFGDASSLAAALTGVQQLFFVCLPEAGAARLAKHDNLLAAARQAGVEHVVYLSLLGAAAASPIPQARWHADTEQKLRTSGMAWTILRPSLYAQSLLGTAGVLEAGRLQAPAGEGRVAFIDRSDIGRVAAACLLDERHHGQTYALTGPAALSWHEVAAALAQLQGRRIVYDEVAPEPFAQQLRSLGRPEGLITGMLALFAEVRAGRLGACTDAVAQVIGRKPRPLTSALAELQARPGST